MRRTITYAVALATAAVLAGCDTSGPEQAAPAPSAPATAPSTPLPEPPPSNPAPTGSAAPTMPGPTTAPSSAPEKLKTGAKGQEVIALQQSLTKLGYWNGKADGTFGSLTRQAVFALQKAAGLTRDGVVGPKTRKALDEGVRPQAKSDSGRVIEINKKRQLLMLVDDGEVTQIFNTSTGSYERYETASGGTAIAATPSGKFKVYRQIDGWRNAPLGMLWRPKYFNGGIAVHGAPSVPPYPASHGCARLSVSAMNHLWGSDQIPLKTKVWVY
ncbi:L,D-transpeptidase family protein [Couchioplanes caeruleus]|uniref:Peptidoglycan-binding protein n=1 Tax=Couchioplanes caeruleus subsp. caeruleus TaxID=56427 RepID=A0A1K0GP46_9ACTN|nr:L,D-transpeptidase family protein [Couchioplanes caeruleus]OJF10979.1 peptidoglycan-binding protein [Couchioplanes caeruleus subsp. caeruleus]